MTVRIGRNVGLIRRGLRGPGECRIIYVGAWRPVFLFFLFFLFLLSTSRLPFPLRVIPPFPFCFTFIMPPKKAAAKGAAPAKKVGRPAKVITAKTSNTKTADKAADKPADKPAARGRGRPKKMTTETTVKTAVKKDATETSRKTKTTTTTTSRKRKADAVEEKPREPKKPRVIAKPRAPKAKAEKPKVVINKAPKTRLNVFVCGEGSSGELGLGTAKNVIDVKRPRLNQLLAADKVGVVQIAVGGMHCVALTHDNKILTWGVNDQGALGRDTAWEGGYKSIDENGNDSDSDSDDEDSGLNPHESTPTAIPTKAFPEGTVFVEVAAADSASFALTDDGLVYGWGTFRVRSNLL